MESAISRDHTIFVKKIVLVSCGFRHFPFVSPLGFMTFSFIVPAFSALCQGVLSFVQQTLIEHPFWAGNHVKHPWYKGE